MDTSDPEHVDLEDVDVVHRADGLRVLRARTADGARLLCVHNTGADDARFSLDELDTGARRPHFVGGAMRTTAGPAGGVVCHLDPGGHVCLTLSPAP